MQWVNRSCLNLNLNLNLVIMNQFAAGIVILEEPGVTHFIKSNHTLCTPSSLFPTQPQFMAGAFRNVC